MTAVVGKAEEAKGSTECGYGRSLLEAKEAKEAKEASEVPPRALLR
jgi:hypothetical protein